MFRSRQVCALFAFVMLLPCGTISGQSTPILTPIERRVPPIGIEISPSVVSATQSRIAQLSSRLEKLADHPLAADVDVLIKAAKFAVEQRELYQPKQTSLLSETLDLAENRLSQLESNAKADWLMGPLTVRGFYSQIDDSPQPYGLVIPERLVESIQARVPVPLYVWLHGRGDKTTDIHFIQERLAKAGQISPPDAIVLHPFGRQCIGYKSAGETDVLEAIDCVKAHYAIDPSRVVLMGFSMGGAGAWHLGAHYTDQFVAVSPGAGFAETAEYQKYTPQRIAATPSYERTLWGVHDVPNYVRNFFNLPIVCYSGEKDKQIQAARVMEAAFQKEGHTLEHVIGPGMGHKYHPDSLKAIMARMAAAVEQGQAAIPRRVNLQTQTLRYSRMHWLQVDRLFQHWRDSRVDAEILDEAIRCKTQNIRQLTIKPLPPGVTHIVLDGSRVEIQSKERRSHAFTAFRNSDTGGWQRGTSPANFAFVKQPGLQGPIDDAFLERFLVVPPAKRNADEAVETWTQFELDHLRSRWSALFRGTLPERNADAVTEEDIRDSNLVLFGDEQSNPLLARVLAALPDEIRAKLKELGATSGPTMIQMIYPNPLNPAKYVVFNSGPTFREAHDRTNSLQNPKLPDWSLVDISEIPNAEQAGRVVKAGFFDEDWRFE